MDTITVSYKGQTLSVLKPVADMLKLWNGKVLRTEKEFWDALTQNAEYGILSCRARLESSEN